ncbi:bifunctional ADP-dependent NAD(P)H-hydrate dehydratase/NAD(P)H-hydrate epimerase [Kytococcus sedentarius]|uniref:bifunctional ADP-dependent NAD(P)H-hydrate dehydratase/NAD(P)H-hydrate epimerase n=1 Tax=Kytococcus sedentarius TaxID=1276 RepID=UPI0035BC3932
MRVAHHPQDVRRIEQGAGEVLTDGTLMRRAARGVAEAVRDHLAREGRVLGLVGPGDNGGDALWCLAMLASGAPHRCTAVLVADRAHEAGLAAARRAGVEILEAGEWTVPPPAPGTSPWGPGDVVVDGIVGLSGRPGLTGVAAEVAGWLDGMRERSAAPHVVAVDLPSGADPGGRQATHRGQVVVADTTVAPTCCKPVHLLPATRAVCGEVRVVDIGLDTAGVTPAVREAAHQDLAGAYPLPTPADHKYTRGVLGVAAGSDVYPGAAVLSCSAALYTGVGMVRYLGPERATGQVLARCPEVVPGQGRVQAWLLGPGTSEDDSARRDEMRRLAQRSEPCVLDAGALSLAADRPAGADTVLTPHAGELAGLLGREREEVEADPLAAGAEAAERWGATVVVKGWATVVVPPPRDEDPVATVLAGGTPWMATAGTGDLLAGTIGALLALGVAGPSAACLGVALHQRAGVRASAGGPLRGLELARELSAAVAELHEQS